MSNPTNNHTTAATVAKIEMEETLNRIKSYKGVEGILIMNRSSGTIIKSTLTAEQSKRHALLISTLTEQCAMMIPTLEKGVIDHDKDHENEEEHEKDHPNSDELQFMRIRTRKKEIMIAPEGDLILMVIQNPSAITEG